MEPTWPIVILYHGSTFDSICNYASLRKRVHNSFSIPPFSFRTKSVPFTSARKDTPKVSKHVWPFKVSLLVVDNSCYYRDCRVQASNTTLLIPIAQFVFSFQLQILQTKNYSLWYYYMLQSNTTHSSLLLLVTETKQQINLKCASNVIPVY